MKIITLEEHFQLPEIKKTVAKILPSYAKGFHLPAYDPSDSQLEDLGEDRLKHMDAMGIDVQVLSYPSSGIQVIPAAEAVPLAREANDQLATAIQAHPDRLAGFAALPTPDPEAAAAELERAVNKLGFVGALINGRTNDLYLDDPSFGPILEAAVALDVPLYLLPSHPKPCKISIMPALIRLLVEASQPSAGDGIWKRASTHYA